MADQTKNYMTQEGYEQLEKTLDHFMRVKRQEVLERIKIAREFGDISENSEYDEAKREQANIENEILEMQAQLSHAVIIDESQVDANEVRVGSNVELEDVERGEVFRVKLGGSYEAKPLEGMISNLSPLGSAILGRKKGEVVKVNTPAGILKYRIVALLPKE